MNKKANFSLKCLNHFLKTSSVKEIISHLNHSFLKSKLHLLKNPEAKSASKALAIIKISLSQPHLYKNVSCKIIFFFILKYFKTIFFSSFQKFYSKPLLVSNYLHQYFSEYFPLHFLFLYIQSLVHQQKVVLQRVCCAFVQDFLTSLLPPLKYFLKYLQYELLLAQKTFLFNLK